MKYFSCFDFMIKQENRSTVDICVHRKINRLERERGRKRERERERERKGGREGEGEMETEREREATCMSPHQPRMTGR